MIEKRLHFSDVSEAKAILGFKDELLKTLQKQFPTCRIAARGDEIIMVGETADLGQIEEVLCMLRRLNREQTQLTTQHVRYASSLIKEGKGEALEEMYDDTINVGAG